MLLYVGGCILGTNGSRKCALNVEENGTRKRHTRQVFPRATKLIFHYIHTLNVFITHASSSVEIP